MANSTSKVTFTQIVNLNKGDRDFKKLMSALIQCGIYKGTSQLIPTFIELLFTEDQTDKTIPITRRFLKELRKFQLLNFIRFIGDEDTMIMGDCGDIFYTKKVGEERHKDVTFTVNILNPSHVEIRVKIHPITKTHLNIREISRMTSATLFGMKEDSDPDDIHLAMIKFHRNGRFFEISNNCKEDVHVLFIPTGHRNGRHTIPLFGLSAEDAIRRSKYTDKEFTSLSEAHYPFVSDIVATQQIIQSLVSEITVSERSGSRSVTVAQTYALAEILFGYYLRARNKEKSTLPPKNNFVWFDEIQDGENTFVETYAVNISNR